MMIYLYQYGRYHRAIIRRNLFSKQYGNVGNKEYFEILKGMILNDPKLASYKSILNKLL
jgi:hypothetical protein